MKKLLLTMLGVVGMLCSTSCSDEEIVSSVEGEAMVQFTVELTDGSDASRAISDGLSVDDLYCEVYSAVGGKYTYLPNLDKDAIEMTKGTNAKGETVMTAKVELALVKGQSYRVVFWAQNENGAYTIAENENGKLTNITLNETTANEEANDAFTAIKDLTVTGPISETITLTRPFAQINFGTTPEDFAKAINAGINFDGKRSRIVVSSAASTYNALEGVAGEGAEREFKFKVLPTYSGENAEVLKVGSDDYKYLATAYVLVPEGVKLADLTMEIETGLNETITLNVPTAPVQRNYRTNILGNLLTNQAEFNVVVDPIYAGDKDPIEIWDGKTLAKPNYDEQTKTYSVGTAEELAWIANLVNGTLPAEARSEFAKAENLSGQTVKLTADINLAGQEWTPIGIGSNRFHGTIDGNGYGIYNLTVTQRHGNYSQAALVGNVAGTVAFRNLTIKNATIKCPDYNDDFYGAAVVGTMYGNVTFDNVKVEDSYISGNNKVAALVAHDGVCSSLNINNCHVSGVTFEALNVEDGGSVGGLVGYFQGVPKKEGVAAPYGEHKIANSTVKDCTFNVVNSTNTGKRANGQLIGGIDSKAGQQLVIENCTVENNVWNEKFYKNGVEVAEADRFVSPYGALIGGERDDVPQGEVIIDSKTFIADGVLQDNAGNYYIINAAGLKWVADVVNATTPYTPTIFDNKEVKLMNDIDLNNHEWIPIGDDRSQRTEFHGIFDGQGYTVYNVKITKKTDREDENKSSYGLFGNLKGTVKNLTVSNVSISGAPKFIGALVGRVNGGLVENCHVKNSSVECNNWTIGGVVGQLNDGKISGCTIEGTTVKGYGAVGGIVGIALNSGERTIENCTVRNCAIVQNGSFGGDFDAMFGAVLGAVYSGSLTVDLVNCVAEGNTIKGDESNELCGFVADGDVLKINGTQVYPAYVYDATSKTHKIYTVEGLMTAVKATIGAGEKVVLEADMDLAGINFPGFSVFNPENSNIFDGQNHTISNLKMENTSVSDYAFIKSWVGTIKNLKFDNCHVKAYGRNSVVAANVYANIENVHVSNSSVESTYWSAGLIAGHYNSGNVSNCTVTNSSVKSNGATGAVVGLVNETGGTRTFTNCKVIGCTINNTGIYGASYSGAAVVGMFNISNSTVKFIGCEQTNNTFLGDAHDSLYAPADDDITIVVE